MSSQQYKINLFDKSTCCDKMSMLLAFFVIFLYFVISIVLCYALYCIVYNSILHQENGLNISFVLQDVSLVVKSLSIYIGKHGQFLFLFDNYQET